MGTTRHGEEHTHTHRGGRGDRPADRHARPLRDRPGGAHARGRGPRPRRAGRPAPVRRRPRPDPLRVRAADGAGAAGEAVDRRPEQAGPASSTPTATRSSPSSASGWRGSSPRGRRRRRRRLAPADAGPDHPARRLGRRRSTRPSRPTSAPSRTGSPPSSSREGDALRAGNLLLRAHLLSQKAQDQLGQERDQRGAGGRSTSSSGSPPATVFTNPIPALDLLANGAVQFQMISELAAVYGVEITSTHVQMIGLADDPDAPEARDGRGGDLADRRPVQVVAGRLRGRRGGPGGLDGLPDAHLRP